MLPFNISINSLTFLKNCKLKNLKSINRKSIDTRSKYYKNCEFEVLRFNNNLIIPKNTQKYNFKNSTSSIIKNYQISKFVYEHNLKNIKKFNYVDINYSIDKKLSFRIANLENSFHINHFSMNYESDPLYLSGLKKIDKPIRLKNQNLIIEGGSEIILDKESYIHIKNGCLIINKKSAKKTKIYFKNKISNGIFVENCKKETIIENTIFENLSYFKNDKYFLTGGINFYKTNVKINDVYISNSSAEDAINIIKSKFKIDNIKIENSLSDAIDIDFSEGYIKKIEINHAGGDGIDFSGSYSSIDKAIVSNVKDKALSIGEKTNLNLNF